MKAGVWIVGLAACGAPSVAAPPPPGPPRPVEAPAPEERMTAIPGGVYRLGSEAATPRESDRWVEITAFAIDSYEVTAADYARCVEAGACSQASARADLVSFPPWDAVEERAEEAARRCNVETGRLRHPINCVNYAQATAYCTWRDARLPTAAEWEVAARGARVASRPWGDEAPVAGDANLCAPSCELEGEGDNYIGTSPVGSFARDRTQAGVFDMLGNVGEWTRDFTVPGFGGGTPMWQGGEPVGADDGPQAVVMGADFTARYDSEQTLTRTRALWQSLATAEVGFRCARSTEPSPGDVPREAFRSPEAAGALSPELRRAFERGRASRMPGGLRAVLPVADLDVLAGRYGLVTLEGIEPADPLRETLAIPAGSQGVLRVVQRRMRAGCEQRETHHLAFFEDDAGDLVLRQRRSESAFDDTVERCALLAGLLREAAPAVGNDTIGLGLGTVRRVEQGDDGELLLRTDRGLRRYRRLDANAGADPIGNAAATRGVVGRYETGRTTTMQMLELTDVDQSFRLNLEDGGTFEASMLSATEASCLYTLTWSGSYEARDYTVRLTPTRLRHAPAGEAGQCPRRLARDAVLLRALQRAEVTELLHDGEDFLWVRRFDGGDFTRLVRQ